MLWTLRVERTEQEQGTTGPSRVFTEVWRLNIGRGGGGSSVMASHQPIVLGVVNQASYDYASPTYGVEESVER